MDFNSLPIEWILLGYFSGSIPFAIIWPKIFNKGDPRTVGSGNPGATNVMRLAGVKFGILVYICDFLKSAIPVFLAPPSCKMMTGLACVFGHMFSIFLKFKGGKGVATACGVLAAIAPMYFVVAVIVFMTCLKITGYVSLGSLLGMFSAWAFSLFFSDFHEIIAMAAMFFLILYAHRENITRLIQGKESAIWSKKKR